MKQVFRSLCAASILLLVCGFFTFTHAQTPDPFVTQITSSARDSFANDISGDGRFVVIESTGDIATNSTNKNNADGNREIFLFDNTQNSIFQITNTTSALNDRAASSTVATNIRIEIDNIRPVISRDGRFIVFSSNAPTPASFNANALDDATLTSLTRTDGFNTELFIYQVPTADTKSGGTLTRLTTTQASRAPQSASATRAAFIADDNRDAAVSDDGSLIAFASTVRVASDTPNGSANTDGNSEIFIYSARTGTFTQLTNTTGDFVFNDNPSLSADGSTIAFISNAIIAGGDNNDDGRGNGNAEIFLAGVNSNTGAVTTAPRQITRTKASATVSIANILSPGRRLSRDGNFLAFESSATSPTANDGVNQVGSAIFVYNVAANSFSQFGPRAADANNEVIRFPTFSDYQTSGGQACTDANRATCTTPTTLVFASRLSFTATGDAPPSPTDASSLNPNSTTQIFSVPLSQPNPATTNRFTRLTNTTTFSTVVLTQPLPSDSARNIAFSLGGTELGGGNADNSSEVFYLRVPQTNGTVTPASPEPLRYFTGASLRDVVAPSATPTPPAVSGVAPGMLVIVRPNISGLTLAPSEQTATNGSVMTRSPSLPVVLNGVSLSISGAAAGLQRVAPGEIQFVVPPGLAPTSGTNTYPVVINNNGAVIRSALQIVPAQPDIFTTTTGPSGRAMVFNVTNSANVDMTTGLGLAEPPGGFSVTSPDRSGAVVATRLALVLTGVRNVTKSQIRITLTNARGSTDLTGDAIVAINDGTIPGAKSDSPGFDEIVFQLPASLAGAGDVSVVVSVTINSVTYTSRPTATAPVFRIS